MTKYLKEDFEDLQKFENNIKLMDEIYTEIRNLTNGTIRMNNIQQPGFTPATRLADKILDILPANSMMHLMKMLS